MTTCTHRPVIVGVDLDDARAHARAAGLPDAHIASLLSRGRVRGVTATAVLFTPRATTAAADIVDRALEEIMPATTGHVCQ